MLDNFTADEETSWDVNLQNGTRDWNNMDREGGEKESFKRNGKKKIQNHLVIKTKLLQLLIHIISKEGLEKLTLSGHWRQRERKKVTASNLPNVLV